MTQPQFGDKLIIVIASLPGLLRLAVWLVDYGPRRPAPDSAAEGYTIWGQVTDGLDIVRAIAEAGVADGGGDGLPAQPIVIESATVGTA